MDYTEGMNLISQVSQANNAWSAEQAQKQMAFEERMSNTAHQREVADLKAAGLNPILSAHGSGASTPTGAMGGTDTNLTSALYGLVKDAINSQMVSAQAVASVAKSVSSGSGSASGKVKSIVSSIDPQSAKVVKSNLTPDAERFQHNADLLNAAADKLESSKSYIKLGPVKINVSDAAPIVRSIANYTEEHKNDPQVIKTAKGDIPVGTSAAKAYEYKVKTQIQNKKPAAVAAEKNAKNQARDDLFYYGKSSVAVGGKKIRMTK